MKKLIAVRGVKDTGKTCSIKMAYKMLKAAYPRAKTEEVGGGTVDIARVITIDGVNIGIESQGDPTGHRIRMLDKSLPYFAEMDCQLIICATRTSGATVDGVEEFSKAHEYKVKWIEKCHSSPEVRDIRNETTAQEIVQAVQAMLCKLKAT